MGVNLELAAGVNVELATSEELDALPGRILGGWHDAEEARRAKLLPLITAKSVQGQLAGNTSPVVIDWGSPGAGRKWNLYGWAVASADDHTTISAWASLYIGDPYDPYTGVPPLSQLVDPDNSIPSFQTYPRGSQWANSSEHVFLVCYGTAGAPVVANLRLADYPESAVTAQSI